MSIHPFLAGQEFDPETIAVMSASFQAVCDHLQLRGDHDDPATRLVAAKIIELVQRGVRDREALTARTIREFTP